MSVVYYRLLIVFAASVSLTVAACGSTPPSDDVAATPGQEAAASDQQADSSKDEGIDSESTIWTVLGLAKKASQRDPGPRTGDGVSPILWQAAHDTLDFVAISTDDPVAGALVTDWYSPKTKATERFRITVFVLARALRTDSVTVSVERQERKPPGQWAPANVDKQLASDLENAILQRARQIRRARSTTS